MHEGVVGCNRLGARRGGAGTRERPCWYRRKRSETAGGVHRFPALAFSRKWRKPAVIILKI